MGKLSNLGAKPLPKTAEAVLGPSVSPLRAARFFLLRTPTLPESAVDVIRTDFERGARVADSTLAQSPVFKEALFLASQSLFDTLYRKGGDQNARLDVAAARYMFRMATRCTPFGVFAGVAVGKLGERFQLEIGPVEAATRVCRLDQAVVSTLNRLLRDSSDNAGFLANADLSLNTSAWVAPDGLRYIEADTSEAFTRYRLARIAATEAIRFVAQQLATERRSFGSVAGSLEAAFEVDRPAAEAFLIQLIADQVLIHHPQIAVTGDDVVADYLARLDSNRFSSPALAEVQALHRQLGNISGDAEANVQIYQDAVASLRTIGLQSESSNAVQVDLHLKAKHVALPQAVVDGLLDDLWRLRHVITYPAPMLAGFTEQFSWRYGDAHVPLLEALDEDMGVGFGQSSQLAAPLLRGLAVGANNRRIQMGPRDYGLLAKVQEACLTGVTDIVLSEADLYAFGLGASDFPSSFGIMGAISAASPKEVEEGNGIFELQAIFGPPAAALFGRFCCGDPELTELVRTFIRDSEGSNDEVVVAEFAHLPDGRIGNVLLRPTLRSHEVAYMGLSGAAPDEQIPISDIDVTCQHARVYLYRRSTGQRIIPRVTNAHNFSSPLCVPVYRFMGAVQKQDEPIAGWSWGAVGDGLRYLPGVRYKNIRLARERWRLGRTEIDQLVKAFAAADEAGFEILGRRLPPRLRLRMGDNFLDLDLRFKLDRELLLEENRRAPAHELEAADEEVALARDEAGRAFRHELILPVHRCHPATRSPEPRLQAPASRIATCPGGDWLYAKVYCGVSSMDRLLREVFPAFAHASIEAGCANPFFIRFHEHGLHLRLRVGGPPQTLWGPVRRELEALLAPFVDEAVVSRFEYATYQREYARYVDVERCERLFSIDSLAIAECLELLHACEDPEAVRWRLGALMMFSILNLFELDPAERDHLVDDTIQGYSTEFNIGQPQLTVLNRRYREYRPLVEATLMGRDASVDFAPIVERRNAQMRADVLELKRLASGKALHSVVQSLMHMTANRVFPEQGRLHELALLHKKGSASLAGRMKYDATRQPVDA